MTTGAELPDLAGIIAPLLAQVDSGRRPLFVALAERLAAERYRAWAAEARDPDARKQLLACADREVEIAERVEALHPDAAAVQADLRARHPELEELNRSLFEGRPTREQQTMQAAAERVGASTWRSFARAAEPRAREVFLACAVLEERSAETLERLVGA